MYRYDEFDETLVRERVQQFRGQIARRLAGELTEDEFKPLRLRNGLYLQLHAYMLRISIPYGTLSSRQLRGLAEITRRWDKGYGHFTTRTNLQLHWAKLVDVADMLDALADIEMHCIQTSGDCIRNVSTDQYAGAIAGEIEDPRPTAELIRQWSTLHPEFSFLPRKYKIAVIAMEDGRDRAAMRMHDTGVEIVRNAAGEIGYAIWVGGGLGATPMIGHCIREFLPREDLLSYLEAVLRTYNELGRRDNKAKARIKILVHKYGAAEFARIVEEEFAHIDGHGDLKRLEPELERIKTYFAPPPFEPWDGDDSIVKKRKSVDPEFARWLAHNTAPHKAPGYIIVNVSLKPIGGTPGDCSNEQMDLIADLAERFSFDDVRVTHEQNLVLPHVRLKDLLTVYDAFKSAQLATPNIGLISDIIACPGLDYCDLANARSISVAQMIAERFADPDIAEDIGELKIKISGCINACGHHHVGHIGILGVEKKGKEFYQVTLGGSGAEDASLGAIIGPAFSEEDLPGAIDTIIDTYRKLREPNETFLKLVRRVGIAPFKERLYAGH